MAGKVVKLRIVPKTKPKPTRTAPKWLRKEARAEWQRLFALLEKKGTLTPENEPMLADYCGARSLIAECDRELSRAKRLTITGADGNARPHPLIAARNRASQNAISLAKKLGIFGTNASEQPKGGAGDADPYALLGI